MIVKVNAALDAARGAAGLSRWISLHGVMRSSCRLFNGTPIGTRILKATICSPDGGCAYRALREQKL